MFRKLLKHLLNSNQTAATIQSEEIVAIRDSQEKPVEEVIFLTPNQIEFALSVLSEVKGEFELAVKPDQLTIKDLNRLTAYSNYKNKGTLVNLVKKGVLKTGEHYKHL